VKLATTTSAILCLGYPVLSETQWRISTVCRSNVIRRGYPVPGSPKGAPIQRPPLWLPCRSITTISRNAVMEYWTALSNLRKWDREEAAIRARTRKVSNIRHPTHRPIARIPTGSILRVRFLYVKKRRSKTGSCRCGN